MGRFTQHSLLGFSASIALLAACQSSGPAQEESVEKALIYPNTYAQDIVFAVNLGGSEYQGFDGVNYQKDTLGISAATGAIDEIKGSQDPTLFQSYREGDLDFSIPLQNGFYDITFKFAEPHDLAVGERVFDILAEGQAIVEDLDIRLGRDGNIKSALVRTAINVPVLDGELNLEFAEQSGQPLLSAIIVRSKSASPEKWQVIWQDEFNYSGAPDPQKWSFDEWPARKVNGEDQAYTSRPENARVENGHLIIQAHKEQYGNAEYTSARLHSLGKGDFLYGRVDARARVPAGQGTWSAIWMLPSDAFKYATKCAEGEDWQGSVTCDAWPNSGEIDILEHVGYDMQTVHGTVHNKAYYWVNWQQRKASIEGQTVDREFHTYSMEWSPEHIIIFFDDVPYFYYRNEGTGWQAWPFDHPYHLILNLAIGGAWGRAGGPIDDSIFPVQMEVDYVRVSKPAW